MSTTTPRTNESVDIEPERYELSEEHTGSLDLTRRALFKALGAGLLICCAAPSGWPQESGSGRRGGFGANMPQEIGAWLLVGADGRITGLTGKVEVGQNARTSLTQVIAEELRVPVSQVGLVMGDTALTPFDMGTFGSMTTPVMAPQLRRAAAAAREALIDMAAEEWTLDRTALVAENGEVREQKGGRSIAYGQLTRGQKISKTISIDTAITPPSEWKIEGHAVAKVAARDMVTGSHKYASDIKRPGMLYGRILRPAAFTATLVALNGAGADRMAGVTLVRDGDFVGVTATDQHIADRAIEAITAQWKTTTQPSGADIFDYLRSNPSEERSGFGGSAAHTEGSIADGMAAADVKLHATYTVAYIAHTPLEPRAAVAEWTGEQLTVWTGTQRPFGVQRELAAHFGAPESHVRVIVPDTGSGYGGKHTGECAIEAARLAKAAGKPVKVVWTREEEFTWAYFRPAGVMDVSSGAKSDGTLTAWEFHNYNSGSAGIGTPYDVEHKHEEFHAAKSPLRQGSYRALASTANHFARECHIDELARAVKTDPVAFRMKNLKNDRIIAALHAATERFGWSSHQRKPGTGIGAAAGTEKGGHVATCVEAAVDREAGSIRVLRVVQAFECGAIINPDHLRNQNEGAVMMALGGALFEHIDFADGRILNPHLSQYRVPRFGDMPHIEVVLLDRRDLPSAGAGESPMIGLAPALGNAVFDACGVRVRSMPMRLEKS